MKIKHVVLMSVAFTFMFFMVNSAMAQKRSLGSLGSPKPLASPCKPAPKIANELFSSDPFCCASAYLVKDARLACLEKNIYAVEKMLCIVGTKIYSALAGYEYNPCSLPTPEVDPSPTIEQKITSAFNRMYDLSAQLQGTYDSTLDRINTRDVEHCICPACEEHPSCPECDCPTCPSCPSR